MRALPLALFLAFTTWIVGCSAPDVVGTRMRGADTAAGDDDDDAPKPAKKKSTSAPTGATETTTPGNTTPTNSDAVVTPPTDTSIPTETTTTPETTPTPAPAPTPAPTPTVATPTKFTTTANLNLREGPSTGDAILLTMPKGSEVEAIDETPTNNWYHVTFNGQDGYASGSYLEEK